MSDPTMDGGPLPGAVPPPSATGANPWPHPEQLQRHSYPVAIRRAGFATALPLLLRTLPYALVRFAILLAFSIATLIWLALTFGIGAWLGAKVHELIGLVWIVGGIFSFGYLWFTVLRYGLHLVECGHIAVLTELITMNRIANDGSSMFAYGIATVKRRFAEVTVLFALNALINGVVSTFNRTLDFIGELLPIPGLEGILRLVHLVINAATRYIDKAIFSYNLARGDANPWRSSQDGILYYCQNAKEILKTSVWVVVLDKLLTVAIWFLLLGPSVGVALLLPHAVQGFGTLLYLVIAALFAANIRSAFLKPLFLIMILAKYHLVIEGQAINAAWDQRLTEVSKKFVELKNQAAAWAAGQPAPAAPAATA